MDATNVYWTNQYAGTVMKVPTGGGSPVTLAAGTFGAYGLAIDSTNAYWVTWSTQVGAYQVPWPAAPSPP